MVAGTQINPLLTQVNPQRLIMYTRRTQRSLLTAMAFCALPFAFPGVNAQQPAVRGARIISDSAASIHCIHDPQIAAQSDGLILEMLADEGSHVKKGDKLLVIDDRVAQAELAVAQKEFEAAQKQADETANVEYAKKASEVADAEFDAEKSVFQRGSSNESALRRKKLEAEKARLGIRASEVEHQKEILAAMVAKEKVHAAEVNVGLRQVYSQYDGVIARRLRDQGEWVRAGEPVLHLMHMNEMRVEALVPLKDISVVELQGAPMKIFVKNSEQQVITFEANVEYVSPQVDLGKVRIWTRVQNQAPGGVWLLRAGMPAAIEITINK
jgi:multidrug resistance efflux pump